MGFGKPTSAKTASHLSAQSCAATFTVEAHFLFSQAQQAVPSRQKTGGTHVTLRAALGVAGW